MKRDTILLWLTALLCLVGSGWLVLDVLQTRSQSNNQQPSQQTTSTPQPISLTLPNGTTVPAIEEDYNDPASIWVVVSKTHPLSDPKYAPTYIAQPDVAVNDSKSLQEKSVRRDIVPKLEMLFESASTAGYKLMLASGYRSYELQQSYYDNYVRVSGEAEANKFSAKPGQSEHQTGLAFDISLPSRECYLETCFADTDAAKWLAAHAHEYGFILRYPKDKTAVTKYQFEPWHFRYVGKELATALFEANLTLDEVYDALQTTRTQLIDAGMITE